MLFYFVFYTVLFSSSFPLISIYQKTTNKAFHSYENKAFVYFLLARVLTDLSVFIFGRYFGNSMPVFHFSVLIEFILLIIILNSIHTINPKQLIILFGGVSFVADLTLTSDLFSNNLFSSIVTFGLVIGITGKMIISNNTTPKNELLIYSLFLYYILALSYTFFQKFNFQTELLNDIAFYIFALATFVFNISLSFVVCTVKSK
ncbi:MAG: hypothetical protein NTY55_11345 [Flavobacteriia bacterium]|nr:hypothetical protein [Flavobacteriia bacterium]